MESKYELKEPSTFKTVFIGTEKECMRYIKEHVGTYEWWEVDELTKRRNVHDSKGTL